MELIMEKGNSGRCLSLIAPLDVPEVLPKASRHEPADLPEVSETEISRHYSKLERRSHGVNDGFYPLGSCTMKYNPSVNEITASLPGFTDIHPLQPSYSVRGAQKVIIETEKRLCAITGMDAFTFQPAAGAHGEFTGLCLIKAYFEDRGELGTRNRILVPDSAHGTNPASAAMAGFEVVNVPSGPDGCVDLEELKKAADDRTAGLMLTNPNTVGLFDKNILKITEIIHKAGGLCYYDGANLNAVMGIARPRDMGFDVVHLNLHKTFSTPHGGGGPGSGPVGCIKGLADFLPGTVYMNDEKGNITSEKPGKSIGNITAFNGNFLVIVRALTYLLMLGREGVSEAACSAVLNANYIRSQLKDVYTEAYDTTCMHEFVLSLQKLKDDTGVSALDIAKGLLDLGIHPPTMYFPLIVHEALMIEPTETETKETMDEFIKDMKDLFTIAHKDPDYLHSCPHNTVIGRPDEVAAARKPILTYQMLKSAEQGND
jgi:glycine dehydrogenase subunit 2